MIIRKWLLYLFLLFLIIIPFASYKIVWLVGSSKATGTMGFVGKNQTGQYMHTYSVIFFKVGESEYWFNGLDNVLLKEGEQVAIRYQRKNPYDAKLDMFVSIWGDILVYAGILVAVLTAVFIHPHIIQRGARFSIQKRMPFISLVR